MPQLNRTPGARHLAWAAPLLLAALVTVPFAARKSTGQPPVQSELVSAVADSKLLFPQFDPRRVEGIAQCVDCHRPAIEAWQQSAHAGSAFIDYLRAPHPETKRFAEALNIPLASIARDSLCVNCHATPHYDETGEMRAITAVTCESCHNPSGGANGWLNPHAVYGFSGTRRSEESPSHRQARYARCDQGQMNRTGTLYALARRCYECHIVGHEELVNKAGHPDGGPFEFVVKSLGEVRHNLMADPRKNAEVSSLWSHPAGIKSDRTNTMRKRVMYVVGQLARLEVSLRNLSGAKESGEDYDDAMSTRVIETFEVLNEEIVPELGDSAAGLQTLMESLEPVYEALDDDGFEPERAAEYAQAADRIAAAGTAFAAEHDGSQLGALDELNLIPAGPFEKVYQPK